MDRKIAPAIHAIRNIDFPKVDTQYLDNGIPLHILSYKSHEIIKLELVFKAGRSHELEPLTAKATSSLLKEGTEKYSSEQLAEKIDFYGSTISCSSGMDTNTITLFCIKKHFEYSLKLLEEILFKPTFPQEELVKYQTRSSERLHQELSKNAVVAYRNITELIFGKDHCYGYNSYPESYPAIELEDLVFHFQHTYTSQNCHAYLSGYADKNVIQSINKTLGHSFGNRPLTSVYNIPEDAQPQKVQLPGNKLQNSIKLGKRLFNRHHPDFYNFFMLNTVLGGYFGARLMSSIREKKGYTYNIYSVLDTMEHDGYFYISTEVGTQYQEKTLSAINEEIKLLQNKKVEQQELNMAKNYLLGNFLSLLDGPLKSSKVLKLLVENDLTVQNFDEMVQSLANVTSDQLMDSAQKHLVFNDLHQVSIGDF